MALEDMGPAVDRLGAATCGKVGRGKYSPLCEGDSHGGASKSLVWSGLAGLGRARE